MREETALARVVEGSCGSCGSTADGYMPGRDRGRPILWSVLLACLLLLISPPAQAACRVGLIDTDTTWSMADSPCIVDQGVRVIEGVTLVIEPGVTVKVNRGLAIQIDGTLIAQGTPTELITFTSNASRPSQGDWGYIYFTDTSSNATFDKSGNYASGSILQHCIIEYAGNGNNAAVHLDHSSI